MAEITVPTGWVANGVGVVWGLWGLAPACVAASVASPNAFAQTGTTPLPRR